MVKLGIIGLGTLGTTHAENIIYNAPNAELIAVCSRRQEVLDEFNAKHNIKYSYNNFDEMLKNDELDAVLIVTSVNSHFPLVMKAIDADLHVFVEKPLALTTEEAISAQEASERNPGKILMTGYMRRFDPSYAEAKQKIDAGLIGKPIMFRGYSLDHDSGVESAPERGENNGTWYSEMIVHDIDLARWLLGTEAEDIRTIGGCYKHKEFEKYNDIDNACTLMKFKNNLMAMFYTGRTAPHGSHIETEIVGTEGILRISPVPRKDRINIYNKDGVLSECMDDYISRFGEAFKIEIQEFINCIEEGRKPEMTAYDSRMVCETANKAYEAYVCGELVKM